MPISVESSDKAVRVLPWLIPITYLLHIAEELWGGEGYPAYVYRTRGVHLSTTRFLVAQFIGIALVSTGIMLARRFGFPSTMLIILATTIMLNGFTHCFNAINSLSYNPGLVTSILIWIPMGIYAVVRLKRFVTYKRFVLAMAIGFGINLAIGVITLRGGKII